jgi:hypothetical protein
MERLNEGCLCPWLLILIKISKTSLLKLSVDDLIGFLDVLEWCIKWLVD